MNARISCVAGLAIAILAGCATPLPPGAEPGPDHTMAYNVLVDASAPGARIVVNGQDMGQSPVHIKIFGDPDGTFHDFGLYYYVVQAQPVSTNQFAHARYFRTGHMLTPEDRVPQKIYFDMNHPAPQTVAPYGSPAYGYPAPYYYGPAPYYYGPRLNFYYGPGYHWH